MDGVSGRIGSVFLICLIRVFPVSLCKGLPRESEIKSVQVQL